MSAPDLQPTLEGERVIVRPVHANDWDGMLKAASDPEIWTQHPESDRYQAPVFRNYFDGALASRSAFAFVDRANGNIIGSSRFWGFDPDTREVEIGWTFLARRYWGGVYNAEIKQLMLAHAFTFADTVVFWIGANNQRSRRAVEKIGGTLRDGVHYRGAAGDDPHVVYEIRRSSTISSQQK